ncbi:MAG: c-type cytochrome [Bacteroidota bacterium]
MNNRLNHISLLALCLCYLFFSACQQPDGNSPGSEYMPDMGHSIAYEANHYDYYYYNTWGGEQAYYEMAQPRKPVKGTIPRGYTKVHNAPNAAAKLVALQRVNDHKVMVNGSVPYHYEDTEDERLRATAEIVLNPFPITEDGLARGKELYNVNCAICHGEKGDGNGWIYENGAYPAAPANFLTDVFYEASNGRYYHALIYGKNVMGGYADKLSYEERWQVIHWIHALQAKEKKLAYNADENTLNNIDIPSSEVGFITEDQPEEQPEQPPYIGDVKPGQGGQGKEEHSDSHSEGSHGGQGH